MKSNLFLLPLLFGLSAYLIVFAQNNSSDSMEMTIRILGCASISECRVLCNQPENFQRCNEAVRRFNPQAPVADLGGLNSEEITLISLCKRAVYDSRCSELLTSLMSRPGLIQRIGFNPTKIILYQQQYEMFCINNPGRCEEERLIKKMTAPPMINTGYQDGEDFSAQVKATVTVEVIRKN